MSKVWAFVAMKKAKALARKEFVTVLDWPVRTEEEAMALVRKLKADPSRAGLEPPGIVEWNKPGSKYLVVAQCRVREAPNPPPRPRRRDPKLTTKKRK
jgi:hypothetical protein